MELANWRTKAIALLCCISLCFFLLTSSTPSSLANLVWNRVHARRSLGGPGSHPPRCEGKCGRCTPCSPVRVTVPPGTPVITEYYPEAWRCKCRNHLYMP